MIRKSLSQLELDGRERSESREFEKLFHKGQTFRLQEKDIKEYPSQWASRAPQCTKTPGGGEDWVAVVNRNRDFMTGEKRGRGCLVGS